MAQQADCNQNSWTKKIKKNLPSDVCLGNEKMAYLLFLDFDYQGDYISDLAIKVGNENISNGDTMLLEIYTQRSDSSFTKFKTLDNIYPTYFENYSLDNEIENEDLSKLKDRYQGFNPLEELKIEHNKITLKILSDVATSFILTYTYNHKKANWFLNKFELYDHNSEQATEDSTRLIGSSIDSFNYFDYLEGKF